jgi:hypothetical protein
MIAATDEQSYQRYTKYPKAGTGHVPVSIPPVTLGRLYQRH